MVLSLERRFKRRLNIELSLVERLSQRVFKEKSRHIEIFQGLVVNRSGIREEVRLHSRPSKFIELTLDIGVELLVPAEKHF